MIDPADIKRQIMSLDPKLVAEAEARLEAARNDPNYVPERIELSDDPDPFGMDWKWLEETNEGLSVTRSLQAVSKPTLQKGRSVGSYVGFGLAASLLIGIGILFGAFGFNGNDSGQFSTLVASATPRPATGRGDEDPHVIDVESKRKGFVTIITTSRDAPEQVFPEPGEALTRVPKESPITYGPLPADATRALVVITETPATSLIRDALLEQEFGADNFDGLEAFVLQLLEASGYHWAGVSSPAFPERSPNN